MKIYGISGLGADERVFQYLSLNCELISVAWITPFKNEPIEKYSLRLAEVIDTDEDFGILGVSFGGLIAVEISKKLKPKITILISSAETKSDLRWIYSAFGKTKIISLIPEKFFNLPRWIAFWLFGTNNKELLKNILDDSDLKFTKWAIKELINWQNIEKLDNCFKIGGTKDKLIPPKRNLDTVLIIGGEHFMIIDRANEISEIINKLKSGCY